VVFGLDVPADSAAPTAGPHSDVLFSGDVLFAGSIGRVDLPGGSWEAMLGSLRDVVLPLDDATVVLPGHGPSTTIGRERATNPYLAEAAAGQGAAPQGRGL
jgi:glyoxylase-like metal-dependent hydrolase (beta-lactamase superfamily II)